MRIGPNSIMTSDAALWRRICAVRSPYVRADWYKGMRFEPDKDIILTHRDDKHMEMRHKMAAGVSISILPPCDSDGEIYCRVSC